VGKQDHSNGGQSQFDWAVSWRTSGGHSVNVSDSDIPASLFYFLINGGCPVYLMKTLHRLLRGVLVEPAVKESRFYQDTT
jgi:hypothetical protein